MRSSNIASAIQIANRQSSESGWRRGYSRCTSAGRGISRCPSHPILRTPRSRFTPGSCCLTCVCNTPVGGPRGCDAPDFRFRVIPATADSCVEVTACTTPVRRKVGRNTRAERRLIRAWSSPTLRMERDVPGTRLRLRWERARDSAREAAGQGEAVLRRGGRGSYFCASGSRMSSGSNDVGLSPGDRRLRVRGVSSAGFV